jgi:Xaa-Pro aminopeptidase
MMDGAVHARRRARVLERLGEDGALIIAAAPELRIGPDGDVRYVPDAYLHWLTGFGEPGALLVLSRANPEGTFVLFVQPRDAERERWTGVRGGVEAARDVFGADVAFPAHEMGGRLPHMVGDATTLYARLDYGRPDVDALVIGLLTSARRTRPRRGRGPRTLTDPGAILDPFRRIKDEHEIHAIREAARITVESLRAAARLIRPGVGEWEIEAAIDGGFRSRGAWGPAFPTIVALGKNATTLHYVHNSERLRAGELLLIDTGARAGMYCADISRTFPVSGRFTPDQRELYDVVLAAHDAAILAAAPGRTVNDVHSAALRALVEGLCEVGFASGDPELLVMQADAWKPFYPHRTSHWLGLDVHDVGDYVEGGVDVVLQPGMVLTIEPGLYIAPDAATGPPSLRGTGIRIEDDLLITIDGREVLTAALPADADGAVALMI